jgi:hypothetical protein
MKDEALRLALEALEALETIANAMPFPVGKSAITAIKQALAAQPAVQEPVAWIEHHKGGDNLEWDNPGGKCTPLYTTPPAQPAVQEPVALLNGIKRYEPEIFREDRIRMELDQSGEWVKYVDVELLITAPPAAQPAPVQPVWIQPDHLQKAQKAPFLCRVEPHKRDDFVPLYTTPPAAQRQWVGLTDAEVMHTMSGDWTSQFYFARAIEAKLKEKNDAAQTAVPDAIHHTDLSEHPQYIEGWNDCRAETLKGMK